MGLRNVLVNGDERLRKKSRPVTEFDQRLWNLLDDLYETMQERNGVGIAAPQVGILRRAVVIDVGEGKVELINPEMSKKKGISMVQKAVYLFRGNGAWCTGLKKLR